MAEPTGSSASAIKDMIETWSRELVARNLDNWATYWVEDCVLMPPRHPRVEGREQVVDYIKTGFEDLATLTLSNWRIEERVDLAVAITAVEWKVKTGEAGTRGKQVIILKKDAKGTWKVQTAIFNTDG